MAERNLRPLIRLVSVVFVLVLLRQSGNPVRQSPDEPQHNLEPSGDREGVFRHLLGVEEGEHLGFRSREWKRTVGNRRVTEGEGVPTVEGTTVDGDRHHSEPVDLSTLSNQTKPSESSLKDTFTACENVKSHIGYPDSCSYVRANPECRSGTMVEYAEQFYCTFAKSPTIGYVVYLVWLMALFYMLGNTAADFFCPSLEKLSKLLHLPPTVAGVSLLPLGNGAPDVFASIAAFTGSSNGQVSLSKLM